MGQKELGRESFYAGKDYKVEFIKYEASKVKLTSQEIESFSHLSSKSKVAWLKYLKEERAKERSLSEVVSQSRYLRLLKDSTGLHVRISQDISSSELDLENLLITKVIQEYTDCISEDINYGMSGDINRTLISKGTLIE